MSIEQMTAVKRIHLIGIGGVGMGAIAEVLLGQGHEVSGSDPSCNAMTERLKGLRATISQQHSAQNIENVDVVVISSAITNDNPEVVAAREKNIPVIQRAEMLAELMRAFKQSVAVAGTHGKTTTTSLVSSLLIEASLDPTYVIGGLLKSAGSNAHLGRSDLFVAEADESDASFLFLRPKMAIVTNIDADHLTTYGGDFNRLCDSFVEFLHNLPEDGLAVLCVDDPVVERIIPRIKRPVITYGFNPRADVCITEFQAIGTQTQFKFSQLSNGHELAVTLNLMGRHNALNAAAAYIIASRSGASDTAIIKAFASFAGVGRRLQQYGELTLVDGGKALVIDDYGHHPSEIAATWSGIRQAWPEKRLVVLYQPHRYSRTQELFEDFIDNLAQADQLLLLPIYAAGEKPIEGIDSTTLLSEIRRKSRAQPIYVGSLEAVEEVLKIVLRDGDILLTQGAGSVGTVAPRLAKDGMQLK